MNDLEVLIIKARAALEDATDRVQALADVLERDEDVEARHMRYVEGSVFAALNLFRDVVEEIDVNEDDE